MSTPTTLGDSEPISIPLPRGFVASGLRAGVKKRPGLDLGLLLADAPRPAHAVFTTNSLLGAHVPVCREHLARSGGLVQAVIVNSGNANCATGRAGEDANRAVCAAAAAAIGCATEHVLCLSTGVIGALLPVDKIVGALPELFRVARADGAYDFARAILTTDTCIKHAHAGDAASRAAMTVGVGKGSGMIHPDMATMLAFILSDAAAPDAIAQRVARIVGRSFHCLTVDGDTSPNDTVLFWTSGLARDAAQQPADAYEADALTVARALCQQIAKDGEGATRTIRIVVEGALDEAQAARVGRTIGTSMLTKTAVTGRDPNWGRILSAAGRAARFDAERARVWVGDAVVYEAGRPHPENEPAAHRHLATESVVELGVDLGLGAATAEVWSCDLTADYVSINADYRS